MTSNISAPNVRDTLHLSRVSNASLAKLIRFIEILARRIIYAAIPSQAYHCPI